MAKLSEIIIGYDSSRISDRDLRERVRQEAKHDAASGLAADLYQRTLDALREVHSDRCAQCGLYLGTDPPDRCPECGSLPYEFVRALNL